MAVSKVSLRADLGDLRRELKKVPGITETEAKAMVRRFSSQMKAAERASTKAWKKAKRKGPDKYKKSISGLKGVMSAVIGGVAVAQAAKLATAFAAVNDELNETAKRARELGVEAEEFQAVSGALDLTTRGIDPSTTIQKFSRSLGEAKAGTAEYLDTFDALGLSVDELIRMDLEEQIIATGTAISGLETSTERTTAAMELFGRSGGKMIPLFDEGGKVFREAAGRIKEAGVVSNEAAAQAEVLADAGTLLNTSWMAVKADLLTQVSPALVETTDNIREMLAEARETGDIERLGDALEQLVSSDTLAGLEKLVRFTTKLGDFLNIVADTVSAYVQLQSGLADLVTLRWEKAGEHFGNFADRFDSFMASLGIESHTIDGWTDSQRRLNAEVDLSGIGLEKLKKDLENLPEPKPLVTEPTGGGDGEGDGGDLGEVESQAARAMAIQLDYLDQLEQENAATDQAMAASRESRFKSARDQLMQEDTLDQDIHDEKLRRIEEERQTRLEAQEQTKTEILQTLNYWNAASESIVSMTQAAAAKKIEAAKEGSREEKKAAKDAFYAAKAAAIAQAAVSTALAVINAIANTPGPIWVQIAAGVAAGVAGGVAIAQIAAESPPSFHAGGEVTGPPAQDVPARLQQGEVVFSRDDVARSGGPEEVDAMRRQDQRQGARKITVVNQSNNRTTSAMEYEMTREGSGPYMREIERAQPTKIGLHNPYAGR